jgi:hypothetical protein
MDNDDRWQMLSARTGDTVVVVTKGDQVVSMKVTTPDDAQVIWNGRSRTEYRDQNAHTYTYGLATDKETVMTASGRMHSNTPRGFDWGRVEGPGQ